MISFQLTGKMAMWFPASHLLLIVLLSWNVCCFPAGNSWSQRELNKGSVANMEASPDLYYTSSQSAPPQPSGVGYPAVSVPYDEVMEVYSSPGTDPASPTSGGSRVASWNAAFDWGPEDESTTPEPEFLTPQPLPGIVLPYPPPLYQAGELERYEKNSEHGNSEVETEELSVILPPLPPPYPGPGFQGGELEKYTSVFEHGNEERETEEQGFSPQPPYTWAPAGEVKAASVSGDPMQPHLQELGPSKYLFVTGQLPPGTISHFSSDYETGADHWDEVHYEKYHNPVADSWVEQAPSEPWEQPQYHTKV